MGGLSRSTWNCLLFDKAVRTASERLTSIGGSAGSVDRAVCTAPGLMPDWPAAPLLSSGGAPTMGRAGWAGGLRKGDMQEAVKKGTRQAMNRAANLIRDRKPTCRSEGPPSSKPVSYSQLSEALGNPPAQTAYGVRFDRMAEAIAPSESFLLAVSENTLLQWYLEVYYRLVAALKSILRLHGYSRAFPWGRPPEA
jgi:hypothetical protein